MNDNVPAELSVESLARSRAECADLRRRADELVAESRTLIAGLDVLVGWGRRLRTRSPRRQIATGWARQPTLIT